MYRLFLDDQRKPNDVKWVELPWVRGLSLDRTKEFCNYIEKNGLPEFISFDHDLGQGDMDNYIKNVVKQNSSTLNYQNYKEKTGLHCVSWLIGYCIDNNVKFPKYVVHSMNVIGRDNIVSLIEGFNNMTDKLNKMKEL